MYNNREKIRWGIIGCGNVTEKKSGPAFYTLPGSALVAVMRRDEAKAADYAKRHGVPKYYTDGFELIRDPGVDAVYVATPPDTHALYAIAALEAGKPVYVEKPMALNYRQCSEMIEASERTGVPLYVAYYRRALPFFRKVNELLVDGAVGRISHASMRLERPPSTADYEPDKVWRLDKNISGGGYFVDLGAHQINLLQFLFGPVAAHKSFVANKNGLYEVEDFVSAIIEHQSGVHVNCTWYFGAPEGRRIDELEIVGSEGIMRFSVFGMNEISIIREGETRKIEVAPEPVIQKPLIASINQAIRDDDFMAVNLHDAAATTLIMQKILEM
jgi:predicted dehydrogenase